MVWFVCSTLEKQAKTMRSYRPSMQMSQWYAQFYSKKWIRRTKMNNNPAVNVFIPLFCSYILRIENIMTCSPSNPFLFNWIYKDYIFSFPIIVKKQSFFTSNYQWLNYFSVKHWLYLSHNWTSSQFFLLMLRFLLCVQVLLEFSDFISIISYVA